MPSCQEMRTLPLHPSTPNHHIHTNDWFQRNKRSAPDSRRNSSAVQLMLQTPASQIKPRLDFTRNHSLAPHFHPPYLCPYWLFLKSILQKRICPYILHSGSASQESNPRKNKTKILYFHLKLRFFVFHSRYSQHALEQTSLKRYQSIKTTMGYCLTPVRMATTKKPRANKCWQRCGEKEILIGRM